MSRNRRNGRNLMMAVEPTNRTLKLTDDLIMSIYGMAGTTLDKLAPLTAEIRQDDLVAMNQYLSLWVSGDYGVAPQNFRTNSKHIAALLVGAELNKRAGR